MWGVCYPNYQMRTRQRRRVGPVPDVRPGSPPLPPGGPTRVEMNAARHMIAALHLADLTCRAQIVADDDGIDNSHGIQI
jgi:hypothetical protein